MLVLDTTSGQMNNVGDRFKTGASCTTSGSYVFDTYVDGTTTPQPTTEERVILLTRNETFPPIKSAEKSAWWKLQRIT
ncbi:YjzC family protein [Enhygromyxa salina]|uniref:Uncharacterized protein n=1 Tax=Enhygromyxa salina TaxID=215803 RepID=A0A2S9YWL9_9BACT|nr:YjzC family protein [Enhygromyxa salina]PRQ09498.1 hypothetical protein ENSA7_07400 [Enhygromyxa salina]